MHFLWSQKVQATDSDWVIDSHSVSPSTLRFFFQWRHRHLSWFVFLQELQTKNLSTSSLFGNDPWELPERAGQWYRKGRKVNKAPKKHLSAVQCGQLRWNPIGALEGHTESVSSANEEAGAFTHQFLSFWLHGHPGLFFQPVPQAPMVRGCSQAERGRKAPG